VNRRRTPNRTPLLGLLVVAALVGILGLVAGLRAFSPVGLAGSSPAPVAARSPGLSGGASPETSPGPSVAAAAVPLVPVTSFRAPWTMTDASDVAAILAGTSKRYRAIELLAADRDAALTALGYASVSNTSSLVVAADAATLRSDMAKHRDRLGFLRLDDVEPSVRALGWDGLSLFGVGRVKSTADWPLALVMPISRVPATGSGTYDPATAWTLVAAGDIMLDRSVAYTVKNEGKGVDFPFDGGTAEITGRVCCNVLGNIVAKARRTGNAGAVRDLTSGADLMLANFENPAPDDYDYHVRGFRFSADPALIEGLADAGIDWVSLANNHIANYGTQGILETMANLDRWAIAHGGAGANLAGARAPSLFQVGGISVAVLGYDTIRPDFAATATRPGTNEMSPARVKADVAAARAAGADLVIVFPHWGIEYTARTTALQRQLAHAAIDAGADVVIGSHPHWAGGVEVYEGKPIFYCLGDFVFDIDAQEQTLEGILPELTFVGTRLVQVDIRPYLILEVSQPNLLDPAGSGAVVLDQVFGVSTKLPW
jgi:poly-gamma-glutamate capsule biosynthesis protein CapA/YwtB (metallophosphatase superfamily)